MLISLQEDRLTLAIVLVSLLNTTQKDILGSHYHHRDNPSISVLMSLNTMHQMEVLKITLTLAGSPTTQPKN